MLRMSKLADYAFIILTHMTAHPKENWSASTLAGETTLPLPTVAKLMKLLARANIVHAQRGASGGYHLMQEAAGVSVADIIEAVDGPIRLTECAGLSRGKDKCDCAVGECPVRERWSVVNGAILNALESIKLADFAPSGSAA